VPQLLLFLLLLLPLLLLLALLDVLLFKLPSTSCSACRWCITTDIAGSDLLLQDLSSC
jgi:hypothetical protein